MMRAFLDDIACNPQVLSLAFGLCFMLGGIFVVVVFWLADRVTRSRDGL